MPIGWALMGDRKKWTPQWPHCSERLGKLRPVELLNLGQGPEMRGLPRGLRGVIYSGFRHRLRVNLVARESFDRSTDASSRRAIL
jgi:hypothetical protein